MTKKLGVAIIGIMISILCLGTISEAQTDKEKIAAQKERERKRKIIRKAKEWLNNTTWDITLKESTANKNKEIIEDTLRFTDSKIESKYLASKGFSSTNFTVRVKRENEVIWETMQKGEEKGLAFWRGELDRNKEDGTIGKFMRGVLSRHLHDRKETVIDYTFVSGGTEEVIPGKPEVPKKKEIVEVAPPAVEAAPVEVAEEPAEVKTEEKVKEEPKKERRRWFWQR
jgi:hypothetical protein